jgi:hypothetical protein
VHTQQHACCHHHRAAASVGGAQQRLHRLALSSLARIGPEGAGRHDAAAAGGTLQRGAEPAAEAMLPTHRGGRLKSARLALAPVRFFRTGFLCWL